MKIDSIKSIDVELPDGWKAPDSTLEPLVTEGPKWFHIMNYVCQALKDAGCPENVLVSYRDQAMSGSFRHLVRVSMIFMGELELEHDSPRFV